MQVFHLFQRIFTLRNLLYHLLSPAKKVQSGKKNLLGALARVAFDENMRWLLSQSEKIKSNLIMSDERIHEDYDDE
jgi:hypothetical protein